MLRAYTKKLEIIEFEIEDCLSCITAKYMALTSRPNSPLIMNDSVIRNIDGLWEGDTVYDGEQEIGILVYCGGLKLLNKSNVTEKYVPAPHIEVRDGSWSTVKEIISIPERTPVLYKASSGKLVRVTDFIQHKNGVLCSPDATYYVNDLLPYIGINVDNRKLCLGEVYGGGVIAFKDYQPCIKLLNGEFKQLD